MDNQMVQFFRFANQLLGNSHNYHNLCVFQWFYMWKYPAGVKVCESAGGWSTVVSNSPSCSVVLELVPGDEIYISSSYGYRIASGENCGFTGFLIQPYA